MRTLFLLFGALILMSELTGCNRHSRGRELLPFEKKIPGNPCLRSYTLAFGTDWKLFKEGTYSYIPKGPDWVYHIGGSRTGYGLFDDLIMDFSFTDGRVFHEVIDFRKLMAEMLQRYTIFDLAKIPFGGFAELDVNIIQDKIIANYILSEPIQEEPHRILRYYQYPVFVKDLSESTAPPSLPGNPDLNLYGLIILPEAGVRVDGSYTYSLEGSKTLQIADGGRYGYQRTGSLALSFSGKNGKRQQKHIDIKHLLNELPNNTPPVDLASTKFGGLAEVVVRITQNQLLVDYRLLERTQKSELGPRNFGEVHYKTSDKNKLNYRMIRDLTADPALYTEHRYPLAVIALDD